MSNNSVLALVLSIWSCVGCIFFLFLYTTTDLNFYDNKNWRQILFLHILFGPVVFLGTVWAAIFEKLGESK